MRRAAAIATIALGIFLLGSQELNTAGFADPDVAGQRSDRAAHVSAPPTIRVAPTATTRVRPSHRLVRTLWAMLLVLLVATATSVATIAPVVRLRRRPVWRGSSRRGPPLALA